MQEQANMSLDQTGMVSTEHLIADRHGFRWHRLQLWDISAADLKSFLEALPQLHLRFIGRAPGDIDAAPTVVRLGQMAA